MEKLKTKQQNREYHKNYYKENKEAIKQRRLDTARRVASTSSAAKEWKARNMNNPHIFSPFHGQIPPRFPDSHTHDLEFHKDKLKLQLKHD